MTRRKLALARGEVLCLLGPNGSGKTTLFKTVLGLLSPQGGRVCLNGENIAAWPRRRLARVMGYVPQAHTAYFPFTVIETVLMGRSPAPGFVCKPDKRRCGRRGAAAARRRRWKILLCLRAGRRGQKMQAARLNGNY
jgi:iron complex transport system ATP-binding protein